MADFTSSGSVGDEDLHPANPDPSSRAKAYRFDCRGHGFHGDIQRAVIERFEREEKM